MSAEPKPQATPQPPEVALAIALLDQSVMVEFLHEMVQRGLLKTEDVAPLIDKAAARWDHLGPKLSGDIVSAREKMKERFNSLRSR